MNWKTTIDGEVVCFSIANGYCSWTIFSRKDNRSTPNKYYKNTEAVGEYRKIETEDKQEIEDIFKENILKAIKEHFYDK